MNDIAYFVYNVASIFTKNSTVFHVLENTLLMDLPKLSLFLMMLKDFNLVYPSYLFSFL